MKTESTKTVGKTAEKTKEKAPVDKKVEKTEKPKVDPVVETKELKPEPTPVEMKHANMPADAPSPKVVKAENPKTEKPKAEKVKDPAEPKKLKPEVVEAFINECRSFKQNRSSITTLAYKHFKGKAQLKDGLNNKEVFFMVGDQRVPEHGILPLSL